MPPLITVGKPSLPTLSKEAQRKAREVIFTGAVRCLAPTGSSLKGRIRLLLVPVIAFGLLETVYFTCGGIVKIFLPFFPAGNT